MAHLTVTTDDEPRNSPEMVNDASFSGGGGGDGDGGGGGAAEANSTSTNVSLSGSLLQSPGLQSAGIGPPSSNPTPNFPSLN